jgi:hypothetical protein
MVKSPAHHIRVFRHRLPRHRRTTPPLAPKLAFWGRTPFPIVLVRYRYRHRPYKLEKAGEADGFLVAPVSICGTSSFRGPRTRASAVLPNCAKG